MNKLQQRAARFRTARTFPRHPASHGLNRVHHAVPLRHATSLRAQWTRNPASGALECRWVAETRTEPLMRRGTLHIHPALRMSRRIGRAGMRPPSR